MKKTITFGTAFVILMLIMCSIPLSFAQESPSLRDDRPAPAVRKEKSTALAVGLGLSPIPGDGLIYSGATVAGVTDLVIGISGWTMIGIAVAKCTDLDDCTFPGLSFAAAGVGLVGITYLIDAIGSPLVAYHHNSKLRQKIQPSVGLRDGKIFLGLNSRF